MNHLRYFFRNFFAGLAILIPLIITIGIVAWIFNFLNNFIGLQSVLGKILQAIDFIPHVSEWVIVTIGYLIVVIIIAVVGQAATKVEEEKHIAQKISEFFDRIPLLNRLYKSIEQLWNFIFKRRTETLSQFGAVVIFQLANTKAFGLLASDQKFILDDREYLLIFMPSSPIPATGFNYFVPVENVSYCQVPLEDFAKVHFSLGVLSSEIFPKDLGLRKFTDKKQDKRK